MKHKKHSQQRKHPYLYIDIELLPETEAEQQAINNVRNMDATQEEKDLIENYLIFSLNAITMDWQQGNRCILKCSAI